VIAHASINARLTNRFVACREQPSERLAGEGGAAGMVAVKKTGRRNKIRTAYKDMGGMVR
jgi:hypothetical protein